MTARDRGHVEEIINHLKRIENDYGIDLTEEMEWLRGLTKEKQISEDLEKEIEQYCIHHGYLDSFKDCGYTFNEQVGDIARYFANWQIGQFEKNRLAACERQTEEEAEIERDFVMSIIEKEHRPPTFDDAIKYGMRLQREQMIEKACRGYCDDICEKGMASMCFHKHDGQGQVKNTFKYNECNALQILIKAMKDE